MGHKEYHYKTSKVLRDFVIGMADGLTVPFALTAGLSGVLVNTDIIVIAGLAEIAAGSIAMGLGGYLASKTELDHYKSEYKREQKEVVELPDVETQEVSEIFLEFGVPEEKVSELTEAIKRDPEKWVQFMMKFELGLDEPDKSNLWISPMTIGGAYIIGGVIPLVPYMLETNVMNALIHSSVITGIALCVFGVIKAHFTGTNKIKTAFQTMLIGGAAAITAFFVSSLFV